MEHEDDRGPQVDTIGYDLYCASCEYNLRTLPVTGSCPECGTSVTRSLAVKRTRPLPVIVLATMTVLAAVGPLIRPLFIRGIPSDLVVMLELGFSAIAGFGCCVGWVLAGPRQFHGRHRRLAKVIRYGCALLSLGIGAFWAWVAYFFFYVPWG